MAEVALILSADEQQALLSELVVPPYRLVLDAKGAWHEMHAPMDLLSKVKENLPQSEAVDATIVTQESSAVLLIRGGLAKDDCQALLKLLPDLLSNSYKALAEQLLTYPEEMTGLRYRQDFLHVVPLLQQALSHAVITIRTIIEDEPFEQSYPPANATGQEVGRGLLNDLEETVAEAAAPTQSKGR